MADSNHDLESNNETVSAEKLEEYKKLIEGSVANAFSTIAALKAQSLSVPEVLATASFMKIFMDRLIQLAASRDQLTKDKLDLFTTKFDAIIKGIADKIPDEKFVASMFESEICSCPKCSGNNQSGVKQKMLLMMLEALKNGNVTVLDENDLTNFRSSSTKKEYPN